jgi:hypothetical protein
MSLADVCHLPEEGLVAAPHRKQEVLDREINACAMTGGTSRVTRATERSCDFLEGHTPSKKRDV